jgi:hypothetical protein
MLYQRQIFLAGSKWQQFQPGRMNDVVKIRIGDHGHVMPAFAQCNPQADHGMHVAVAAESRNQHSHRDGPGLLFLRIANEDV